MDSSGADPRAHGSRSVVDILGHTIGVSSISLREIADDISPLGRFWNDRETEPLPAQIGRYRLAGEIARGGGGSIHRARDVDLGRDVALKVLLAHHRENPEVIRRFIEEAQIGGQLQHPGIVPVHEMGLFAGKQPYFVMKLVRGKTLARLLEERQGLSEDRQRFLGIFEHICQTLAFAHARGVIHRDLKPSNVMVGTFGEVQVMDWGLAKVLSRQGPINERSSTEGAIRGIDIVTVRSEAKGTESIAGSVLGTPAYMAPEQARGEMENLDERTDVFGLGAILCEILTGEPPYTGETVDEVHQQAQRGSLHNARARIAACGADREVLAVANRCLAPELRDRPRDAGAVAKEIAAYIESLEKRARHHQIRAAKARLGAIALLFLIIAMTVAGISIRRVELERRDAAARRLHQAVGEAERRAGQAESASTDVTSWSAAVEAARAARGLLNAEIDSATAAQVEETLKRIEENAKLRRLLARLYATGDKALSFSESAPGVRIDQDYQEIFCDYFGNPSEALESMDTKSVSLAIRSTHHAETIALALDDWAFVRWALGAPSSALAALSMAVSPQPWRIGAWHALRDERSDSLVTLEQALSDHAAPAALLTSCAGALIKKEDLDRERRLSLAESLLRRARDREPGSFRANECLARLLSSSDATREESLRYWTAVRALRPDDPSFALALGHAYQINGLHEKALLEYAEALRELPGAWRAEYPLRLLEREDLSFSDRTLDDFILRIERLPASSKVHIPRTWEVLAEAQNRRYRGGQLQNAVDDARRHVRETAQRDPNALLMLSRLLWGAGRHVEAIRAAEESELIAGTSPVLRRYRQSLAPRLVSCTSVEAAIVEAEGVGGGDAGAWRFSENSSTLNPEWLDPAFDDRDWNEGTGDFGWVGVSPSNHLVLRRQFVIAEPKDFDAVGLVVYSTDRTLTVYINGKETSGELVAGPDVDGETRHSFDLASGLRAGTNTVVVDSLRTLFSRNRPRLRPILESQRRSESRAVIFDALRKRFSAKEDGYLFDYAEGRWLQLEGDFTAAAERFRAVLARERREALPFVRLWECLRETQGESDAFAEVRNEIEKAGPNALLPLSPQRPSAVGTEVDGCAVRLETSKFLHLDPRVVHVATRWQVRVTERDDVQDPVVDLLSYKHLTQISLPPHALEPETRYSWRAFHIGTTVETSRASEEVSFMTGKGRREVVPIDLAQHFNRDVVADRGDLRNDSIDDGLCVLIEQGYDGNPSLPGMPTDRRIGVHRLGQYDKPNAIQIDRDDLDPVRIEFPPHRFDVIRFLVTCGHGNANVPVIFEYTDGTTQRDIVRGIDWVTEPNKGALDWGAFPEGVQKLRNNMARMVEGRLSYGTLYGVFDVTIAIDGEKTLGAIVLEANKMEGFFERTHFNLFAITGVGRGPSISRGL